MLLSNATSARRQCPSCNKVVSVPSDAVHPFCVYCGAEISPSQETAFGDVVRDCIAEAGIPDGLIVEGGRLSEYHAPQTNVAIPIGTISIGSECFANMSITTVVLPEGLEEIKPQAFIGCKQLRKVVFPATLVEIGEEAFAGCRSLQNLSLSEGLAYVGKKAFSNCRSLTSVDIVIDDIPAGCFCGCSSLRSVAFPATLRSIAPDAFRGCIRLNEVALSNGADVLTYAGEDIQYDSHDVFRGCSSLSTVICEGLSDKVIRRNFQGTPFLEKWKELHSQLETMREASKDVKTANGQSGDGVMSTIGNAIANAIDGTSTETTSDCDV